MERASVTSMSDEHGGMEQVQTSRVSPGCIGTANALKALVGCAGMCYTALVATAVLMCRQSPHWLRCYRTKGQSYVTTEGVLRQRVPLSTDSIHM
jgi:hypothetical protein